MKIAVSSYSFTPYLESGKMKQVDILEKLKSMGIPNVEFTDLIPDEGVSEEEHAKLLRAEADRLGIGITGYSIGANLCQENADDDKKEVERLKRQVDIARILGVTVMRHDAIPFVPSRFKSFDHALPYVAEYIREVTNYAQTLGIKTTVENHGYVCQGSERVERLLTEVAHENFGLLVDMGNFMCNDEDPAMAVARCAPYAFSVHAKDFYFKPYAPKLEDGYFRTRACNMICGSVLGEGNVPVSQCLTIMKRAGYNGALCLEYEGHDDCIEGIAKGYENLKRIVEEVEKNE